MRSSTLWSTMRPPARAGDGTDGPRQLDARALAARLRPPQPRRRMVPFGGWDMHFEYWRHDRRPGVPARPPWCSTCCTTPAPCASCRRPRSAAAHADQRPRQDAPGRARSTPTCWTTPTRRGARRHHRVVAPGRGRRQAVFDVMPNASNTARVVEALGGTDTSTFAVLAVQGPRRPSGWRRCHRATAIGRFDVAVVSWEGTPCTVAGTGYTGERRRDRRRRGHVGVEGMSAGIVPAGLSARDTLRLEAALPLHGHELGPGVTPLQRDAGVGRGTLAQRTRWPSGRAPPPRGHCHGVAGPAPSARSSSTADTWSRAGTSGARPRHRPRLRAASARLE